MPDLRRMVRILPQHFYQNPDVRTLLADGHSCVLHKKVSGPVLGKEGYVSEHAITLVLRGRLRVEAADGLFVEVPEGKMILLPKGIYTVTDIFPAGDYFEATLFFFEKAVLERFVASLGAQPPKQPAVLHLLLDGAENVRIFTDSLLRMYADGGLPNRQLTAMKLFELLHLLHAANPDGHFAAALAALDNRERRSLREFMEANFAKPLGIEDYAYLTGRSLSSFRRDFKAQFGGVSPKQWLIERRLDRAGELLSAGRATVGEVVLEIGYDNVPHFTKAFRDRFGLPPKQFLIQKRKEALV